MNEGTAMILTHANARKPVIEFKGRRYLLRIPFRVVDESSGITEGPFYDIEGQPSDPKYGYLPDAAYLLGHTLEPWVMHRVQIAK